MSRVCPHCGVLAHFTERWSDTVKPPWGGPMHPPMFRFLETCDNCEAPVCGWIMEGNDPDWAPVWPRASGRKKFPDVPDEIAAAAREAHAALAAKAPKAGVAMARATLEATAKERGITKGTLKDKIEQLAVAGNISEALRMAAEEIRFAGNEVAHGDLVSEPVTDEIAKAIVELMDMLLERIYQEPARIARVRASREERSRQNADSEPQ